jgi:large subunit ribosomal protein L4
VLSNVIDIKNPVRTVLILKDDDPMIKRAARNIPWLSYLTYNRLRAHDLFYARQIVMLEGASTKLSEFYASETKES